MDRAAVPESSLSLPMLCLPSWSALRRTQTSQPELVDNFGAVAANLQPEEQARLLIDEQLAQFAVVSDRDELDLVNHPGSAVRARIMDAGHGRADYLLYVNRKIVGVIEAKPVGTPLVGVQWQSAMHFMRSPRPSSPTLRCCVMTGCCSCLRRLFRDPIHERFRSVAACPQDLQLSETRNARPDSARRRR